MRAALVGTGTIARQHLSRLARINGVDLVAVCDISPISAEFAKERYGAAQSFTDYGEMLATSRPDVVHITTPVPSHYALASDALQAGAHVIVEKPITADDHELELLLEQAERSALSLTEDYNYLFNPSVQELLGLIRRSALGDVIHTEVAWCSDVLGPGSAFTNPDVPHPAATLAGGAIGDFVTHLAALSHAVSGRHRDVHVAWSPPARSDGMATDMVALVEAECGTATLRFSARARPQTFTMRVSGSLLSASASVLGGSPTIESDPVWRQPVEMARRGLQAGLNGAVRSLVGPLSRLSGGPGAYAGIGNLIERTYEALRTGQPTPVRPDHIRAVNGLRSRILSTYDGNR